MPDIAPTEITATEIPPTDSTEIPAEDGEGLPDELLAQPFIAALMQGTPPAVYVPNDFTSPEVELVIKNAEALGNAGFRIYPSKSKPVTVLFNAVKLSPEEVSEADASGKIDQIAIPFQELQEVIAGASGEAASPAPAAAAPVSTAPVPMADERVTSARVKNLVPGTPTSGPTPGQGRLMSNISKPVI